MDKRKMEILAKKGWKTGYVAEFLDLSAVESAYIEMKLALSEKLRRSLRMRTTGLRSSSRSFRFQVTGWTRPKAAVVNFAIRSYAEQSYAVPKFGGSA